MPGGLCFQKHLRLAKPTLLQTFAPTVHVVIHLEDERVVLKVLGRAGQTALICQQGRHVASPKFGTAQMCFPYVACSQLSRHAFGGLPT